MRSLNGVVLSLAMLVQSAFAAPPAPDHPILGIWKLTLPDGSCSEIYRFRGDGTTLVTSAEEISQSVFNIPAQPSVKGFYKLEDRLVKDNGKKDCVGQITKAGATAIHFVHFHPSGALFLMCAAETLDECIGPFRRVQGQET